MKKKTVYVAEDGTQFESWHEAQRHEKIVRTRQLVETWVHEYCWEGMEPHNIESVILENLGELSFALQGKEYKNNSEPSE